MSYPIREIDGIDDSIACLLKAAGIRTTATLLERAKDPKGRKTLAGRTGLDEKFLLRCANMADRMRVKGLGKEFAELVRAAGVDTVRELKHRNAKRLAAAIKAANEKRRLVKVPPSEKAISRWIAHAKTLEIKISY